MTAFDCNAGVYKHTVNVSLNGSCPYCGETEPVDTYEWGDDE